MLTTNSPLLSILIPSYRRTSFVRQTVSSLLAILDNQSSWEIVISNNPEAGRPPPDYSFDDRRIRVVSPTAHLPTAEENLLFGLEHCQGEFVWLLGDDDVPLRHGIEEMFRLLEQRDPAFDLFVFGSQGIAPGGSIYRHSKQNLNSLLIPMQMRELVGKMGFWYVMAGFSTMVLRRKMADLAFFQECMNASKVYSHVSFLIGSFHQARIALVGTLLVQYRQNLHDLVDTGHWRRVASEGGTYHRFSWLTGFYRQLILLMNRCGWDYSFLGQVIDQSHFHRYRFVDQIFTSLVDQIREDCSSHGTPMSLQESDELIAFYEKCAPEYYSYWMRLRSTIAEANSKMRTRSLDHLKYDFQYQARPVGCFDAFIVAEVSGYRVLKHLNTFYAYNQTNPAVGANQLTYLDPVEIAPDFLISESLEAIERKIQTHRLYRTNRDHDKASYGGLGTTLNYQAPAGPLVKAGRRLPYPARNLIHRTLRLFVRR